MNYSSRLCQRLNLCLTESAAPPTTRRLCQQVRSGSPFTSPLQRARSADAGLTQAWNQKLIRSGIFFFSSPSPSPFETRAAAAAADSVEATPTASDHRGLRRSRSICPSSTFIIKCSRSVKSCEDDAHTDWLHSVKCEMGPLIYLTVSDGHFSLSMWPRRMRSTVAACCLLALASQILRNIQKAVHYVTVCTEQQRADCARPVVSCRSREILFICDQNRLLVSK